MQYGIGLLLSHDFPLACMIAQNGRGEKRTRGICNKKKHPKGVLGRYFLQLP